VRLFNKAGKIVRSSHVSAHGSSQVARRRAA
jgi:hypothetical protein